MDLKDIFERLNNASGRQWSQGRGDNNEDYYEENEAPARPVLKLPKLPKIWLIFAAVFFFFFGSGFYLFKISDIGFCSFFICWKN